MQVELHVGILLAEVAYDAWKYVASLRMRGSDDQAALVPLAELLGQPLYVFYIQQYALHHLHQLLAGIGQPQQPLALAGTDFRQPGKGCCDSFSVSW